MKNPLKMNCLEFADAIYPSLPTISFRSSWQTDFKAWILPAGAVEPTGDWHFRWLQNNPATARAYGLIDVLNRNERSIRLAALEVGFVRANYSRSNGTLTMEVDNRWWTISQQIVAGLWVLKNDVLIDTIRVNVVSDGRLLHQKICTLYEIESFVDRVQALPFSEAALRVIGSVAFDLAISRTPSEVFERFIDLCIH